MMQLWYYLALMPQTQSPFSKTINDKNRTHTWSSQRLLRALLIASAIYSPSIPDLPSASGTLVIMIPSNEGLVVGADSRTTIPNWGTCDNQAKILTPATHSTTIVTVTGTGKFVAPPGPETSNLCEYLKSAPPLLDIGEVVTNYLAGTKEPDISKIRIEDLALRCVEAVENFRTQWPLGLLPFANGELAKIVLAGYDGKRKIALIRSFVISIKGPLLKPEFTQPITQQFSPHQEREVLGFGETVYLDSNVYSGIGRKFLIKNTIEFLSQAKTVRETSFRDAAAVVENIIDATSRTTHFIPAPTGIGGSIHIVLLGDTPSVQRIK